MSKSPEAWTFLDMFHFEFIQRAFVAASVIAIVAGLLSCWLVLIGWSLLGDAISHAVLPGVVIAYLVGAPFAVGALIAAVIAVGTVGAIRSRTTLREDTAIGITFTSMFALGLVLVTISPSGTHLQEILFGNLLGIKDAAFNQVLVFGGVAFVVMVAARRALTLWAFDPLHAATLGFNTRFIRWILMLCLACVVVASAQAVGVILVVAMLITPGATAYLLTQKFSVMLVLSPLLAWISCAVGIATSFFWDISTGGAIVLSQSALFTLVYLFGKREGVARKLLQN
ncbi:metal ABC transporter permease [Corynebacterium auriscanis]|uniref:metal ABC transporter permease n=1 Tax=Corynebacterium auriscanis TaxID=99807 RepID=UPI003CEF41DE